MSTPTPVSLKLSNPPPTRAEALTMVRLLLVGSLAWVALLYVYFTLGRWSFNHLVPAIVWGAVSMLPLLLVANWMSRQYRSLSEQHRKFVLLTGAIPFNLLAFMGHFRISAQLSELQGKLPHDVLNKEQFRGLIEQTGLITQIHTSKIVFCVLAALFLAGVITSTMSRGNQSVLRAGLILTLLAVASLVGFIGWLQGSTVFLVELIQVAS